MSVIRPEASAIQAEHRFTLLESTVQSLITTIKDLQRAVEELNRTVYVLKSEQDRVRGAFTVIGVVVGVALSALGTVVVHFITKGKP